MEVTVVLDARYTITPDGAVWSKFGMARSFWERYLEVFDHVRVVARARSVEHAGQDCARVDGDHIEFDRMPDYHGPWQYLLRYGRLKSKVRAAAPASGAVILRVASQVANVLESQLHRRGYPYALEVVGDPYEVFAPGVVEHPLRPFFRWHFSRQLRRQCSRAVGVAYVTKEALQRRYPAGARAISISDVDLPPEAVWGGVAVTQYSSVELDEKSVVDAPHGPRGQGPYRLVTVGSLAQLYKGTDVLIDAVARCSRAGLDVHADIVGDGGYRPMLMEMASRMGVASRVRFHGQLPAGEAVRNVLDGADLFVLPSRTEGLPRAMIEAMARGLPCIGTTVGGVPELLEPSELVAPGDAAALARKLQEVLRDSPRRAQLSVRSLQTAREFTNTVLGERRRSFYRYVRDYTTWWEAQQAAKAKP